MRINIASVLRNDGALKPFSGQIELGMVEFMGSSIDFYSPLNVEGKVQNIGGTLEITAQISGSYRADCSRCGAVVEESLDTDLFESVESDFSDADEECVTVSGTVIDITGSVEACIFNSIPMQFLCKEDCRGLCPVCGINLNEKECNCEVEVYDPRFAIFRNLSKEV